MNNTNKDILLTTLPIVEAQLHDMIDMCDYDVTEALLTAANELVNQAQQIIEGNDYQCDKSPLLIASNKLVEQAQELTSRLLDNKYYHIEYNNLFIDAAGNETQFLDSTVVAYKDLSKFNSSDIVSLEVISKEEYDRYRKDYGDYCE